MEQPRENPILSLSPRELIAKIRAGDAEIRPYHTGHKGRPVQFGGFIVVMEGPPSGQQVLFMRDIPLTPELSRLCELNHRNRMDALKLFKYEPEEPAQETGTMDAITSRVRPSFEKALGGNSQSSEHARHQRYGLSFVVRQHSFRMYERIYRSALGLEPPPSEEDILGTYRKIQDTLEGLLTASASIEGGEWQPTAEFYRSIPGGSEIYQVCVEIVRLCGQLHHDEEIDLEERNQWVARLEHLQGQLLGMGIRSDMCSGPHIEAWAAIEPMRVLQFVAGQIIQMPEEFATKLSAVGPAIKEFSTEVIEHDGLNLARIDPKDLPTSEVEKVVRQSMLNMSEYMLGLKPR